jgi:nitroreductase
LKTISQFINERRSVRKYLPKSVSKDDINKLLESARLAPSACNKQPWNYIVVDDKTLLEEICSKGMGGAVGNKWAVTAPVIIVVCSETSFFTHKIGEMVQGVHYHLVDLGISMEHLVLTAVDLNLGTCYIGWFNEKPIKKTLNIPTSLKVECLITLGYPETIPDPTPRKQLEQIAVFNKYK